MAWFDYAVLTIIAVSILLSVVHGFVREVLAIASWLIAFWVAQHYAAELAVFMPSPIAHQSLRLLSAFILVFLSVLIAMTIVAMVLARILRIAGLGPLDRVLGAVFGFVRG